MRIDVDATKHGFLSVNHAADGAMLSFSKDLLAELTNAEHTVLRWGETEAVESALLSGH